MKRFVEGVDRGQSRLFPECLDDWIDEDNESADSTNARAIRAVHSSWHCRTTAIGTADTHRRSTPRHQPFSHGLGHLQKDRVR